ncbi:MAG: hypothetical protein ACFFG0_19390 [Candidatus Thorarchaeota archaeon]
MAENILYSYALIKTIYEQRDDYIDTFIPFVLKAYESEGNYLTVDNIQKKVEDVFGLSIPEYSLKSIITRAKRYQYITVERVNSCLTEKGLRYLNKLEPEDAVKRRINEVVEDIREFLKVDNLNQEEAYKILSCFINENIEPIVEFLNPSKTCTLDRKLLRKHKYGEKLIEYFQIAEREKPAIWRTIQDLVYGSVLSLSATSFEVSKVNTRFRDTVIYFDSNFIFSLFEFHYSEFNKPAKELLKLLKIHDFRLKIFDFTVDEIVNVLSGYSEEQHIYVPGIKVNSIYSNIKNKGLTVEDIREFIQKIEVKLYDFGIETDPTNINIETYEPNRDQIENLSKYKKPLPYQNDTIYRHDLAAIYKIRSLRKSSKRQIEKSGAIFLTSDQRLSQYNFEVMHKARGTVCEVILDRLLTNILWLKNPTIVREIPLLSIMAIHSNELFVDRRIWRRFYETVTQLKKDNKIKDKDISMLFYNNHIEDVLSVYDESELEKITPDLIFSEVRKITDHIDKEITDKLTSQRKIFEEKIATAQKNEQLKLNKLEDIKRNIRSRTKLKAKIYVYLILYLSLCAIAVNIYSVIRLIDPIIMSLAMFVIAILAIAGIQRDVWHARTYLYTKLFNHLYRTALKKLEIDY